MSLPKHFVDKAEIRIAIDIFTDEFTDWFELGTMTGVCRSFRVYSQDDMVRRMLDEKVKNGILEKRTVKGNFQWRKAEQPTTTLDKTSQRSKISGT